MMKRMVVGGGMLALAGLVACSNGGEGSSSSSSTGGSSSSAASSSGSGSSSSSGGSSSGGTSSSGGSSSGGASSSGGSSSGGGAYTPEQLSTARRAVPSLSILTARAPTAAAPPPSPIRPPAVGDSATYPGVARPIVQGINQQVSGLITLLKGITDLPPTLYNSETREFVWGPFDDENSQLQGDTAGVYVREHVEAGADFRFTYVLFRGIGTDEATFAPVIWGGANPDAAGEEYGSGVILWDFEANKAFEDLRNPLQGALTRGRFVALYIHGPDGDQPTTINTIVLASFHNFIPEETPNEAPINLDHLYGHVEDTAENLTFDFVDIAAQGDVQENADAGVLLENLSLRLASVNGGIGRAEVVASGGDLQGATFIGTECWNALVNRTYFQMDATGLDADGGVTSVETEGAPEDCVGPFSQSLTELNVPSLESVDPALLAALRGAAQNGIPSE